MYDSLHKAFTRMAAHHLKKAKHYQENDEPEFAEEHAQMGEECATCAKAVYAHAQKEKVAKAAGVVTEALELEPTRVSRIAKVFAVPRIGSPELQKTANVPREFERLTRVDEDLDGE